MLQSHCLPSIAKTPAASGGGISSETGDLFLVLGLSTPTSFDPNAAVCSSRWFSAIGEVQWTELGTKTLYIYISLFFILVPSDTKMTELSAWQCVLHDTIVGSSRLNPVGRSSWTNVCLSWWTSFEENRSKVFFFSGAPFYWSGFSCGLPCKKLWVWETECRLLRSYYP